MGRKTRAEMATMGPKIRLRSLIVGCYTPEQWVSRYKRLSEADQFRLWAQVEPKEVKVDQDTTISLIINGIRQVKAIDGPVAGVLDMRQYDADDDAGE